MVDHTTWGRPLSSTSTDGKDQSYQWEVKKRCLFLIPHNPMFNICNSCGAEPTGPGYLVQKENESPKFYADYKDINVGDLNSPNTSMMKVSKSSWQSQVAAVLKSKDKTFVDQDFGPVESSLGQFSHMNIDKWKRVSEIVEKPVLFGAEIQPKQAAASNYSLENGLHGVCACLAENGERIKALFGEQDYNEKGIYKLMMRYKGEIQEVVIDDYVPVSEHGEPLFSTPVESSIWMMLLEKARAKLCGSYQKMIELSRNVKLNMQDLTFAPVDSFKTVSTPKEELWDKIAKAAQSSKPILGYTHDSDKVHWNSVCLTPHQYYTVLDGQVLKDKLGTEFRVLKLRNAFKSEEYKGEGSLSDTLFWDQVEGSDQKSKLLSTVGSKEGVIYMLFSDYLKYFESTFINNLENNKKYYNEELKFEGEKVRGQLYSLQVQKEGNYFIMVDQNDMKSQEGQNLEEGWSRTTILLIKNNSTNIITDYEYLDGCLKYNEQHPNLKVLLSPGNYLIYVKLDPTPNSKSFPSKAHLIVYSAFPVLLKESSQAAEPDLLRRVFSAHGRNNKRQFYNNDLMWSAWKLISQGGYGYISFGNASESQFKFVIKIEEEVLRKNNYKLKKPFKGKGEQTIQILPGQEEIILLRIQNSDAKEIKFPPPMDLQIIPIL